VASDQKTIRAEGWNQYLKRKLTLRWEPPNKDWFPGGSDASLGWTWTFLQYVFSLPDPRQFAPITAPRLTADESSVLARYQQHAQDLAQSEVLTGAHGYSISRHTLNAEPDVHVTAPGRDATVGFLTMLRQTYAPQERASFRRVYDLIAREAHGEAGAIDALKAWKRAHGKLRSQHLDHMILVTAVGDGYVPSHLADRNATHPSQTLSPEQMISAIFYGDTIHWDEQRSTIEAWNEGHAAMTLKRKLDAIRAAVHLGHLYVGFAALVEHATGIRPASASSHLER
jgi:hypothetical protein